VLLSKLLSCLTKKDLVGNFTDVDISAIVYDSRKVTKGDLFVAISGTSVDGHQYIDQAVAQGAEAVLLERLPTPLPQIPLIVVEDSRRAMARLASTFFDHPDRKMRMIGVTGTNGKTTTTNLVKWLFEGKGLKTGLIGTIENRAGDKVLPATHTTPESTELYELLSMMYKEGCAAVVMEVSSHALAQGRVLACDFDAAVFSNLTQDHLDYHGTLAEYLRSKTMLFTMIEPHADINRYSVINLDDDSAAAFINASKVEVVTYGKTKDATLRLLKYQPTASGMMFKVLWQAQQYQIVIPLFGVFNVYNTLAAMAVALQEGLPMEYIIERMAAAPQVPGRFEIVDCGQDFLVVVDYAHTPDGLSNILNAASDLKPQRLISVFGCGGNRDRGKRPIMGKIGVELSDIAIITSDNPRFEEPMDIIAQVVEGATLAGDNYYVEENRGKAIEMAIALAQKGDIVVIAGKGHENYQLIKGQVLHFDDKETVREILLAKNISC